MLRRLGGSRSAATRGFILLALMQMAFGFALNAQQNIVTNYFENILGLQGPQFGYITAIREIPGFLLIFLSALFFRVSLQRVTAGALFLLAVGYVLFGASNSFWTVAPWVIVSSMGYHTVLQTQYALGMSLTTKEKSGAILGRLTALSQGGSFIALIFILITFHFGWLTFRPAFVILGIVAALGGLAIMGFPHLHDGEEREQPVERPRIVLRKEYRYYYWLSLLDGGRQQVFFSFGLYVLVHAFHLSVAQISGLLIAITFASMLSGPTIGKLIDQYGERQLLAGVNVGYVLALAGYAFTTNVIVACACYIIYTFIMPLSSMASATYLRKIAVPSDLAPSFAMGTTLQHAAAIVVPITAGFILNFVGYQIPFMIACGFASLTFLVTRKLDPENQRVTHSPTAEEAEKIAAANAEAELGLATPTGTPPRPIPAGGDQAD